MLRKLLVISAVVLVQGMAALAGADWVQDGSGSLNNNADFTKRAFEPSISSYNGTPYVAWREDNGTNYQVYVKYLVGSTWTPLSGSLNVNTAQWASNPSLAMSGGAPYVAWSESSGGPSSQIYVKYWNLNTWSQIGTTSLNINTGRPTRRPHIAIGTRVYVVWSEVTTGWGQIFVKYFDTLGNWTLVGTGCLNIASSKEADFPSMVFSHGMPYVAWSEVFGAGPNRRLYVKHFDGLNWIADGDYVNVFPGEDITGLSMSTDSNGVVYVAFAEYDGAHGQIYVKHLSGNTWVQDGSGSLNVSTNQNAYYPSIAFSGTTPYVEWFEVDAVSGKDLIYVKHLSGNTWVQDGGILNINSAQSAFGASLVVANGIPYATWQEDHNATNNWQIYVKHYVQPTPTPTPVITKTATPNPAQQNTLKTYNNQINPNRHELATIKWSQASSDSITITIYNLLGDKVVTLADHAAYSAGQIHQITWDGKNRYGQAVGSGIYIVHLKATGYEDYAKIAVVK